jgi:ankyrin repeat protein
MSDTSWPNTPAVCQCGHAEAPNQTIKEYLIAAALQQTEWVCYYLEAARLHPDATWGGKPTALCYAALSANSRLVAYLLEKGADPNRADALGMTPLHYAALGGCEVCVAALLGRGARLNTRNHRGQTPLGLTECQPRLSRCRELLVCYGASVRDEGGGPRRFH